MSHASRASDSALARTLTVAARTHDIRQRRRPQRQAACAAPAAGWADRRVGVDWRRCLRARRRAQPPPPPPHPQRRHPPARARGAPSAARRPRALAPDHCLRLPRSPLPPPQQRLALARVRTPRARRRGRRRRVRPRHAGYGRARSPARGPAGQSRRVAWSLRARRWTRPRCVGAACPTTSPALSFPTRHWNVAGPTGQPVPTHVQQRVARRAIAIATAYDQAAQHGGISQVEGSTRCRRRSLPLRLDPHT